MVRKLVRYRLRPEAIETVRGAIGQFVSAIAQHEPNTIYGAFQVEDSPSFVHAMAFPDQDAEEFHRNAAHTKRFVEVLYPNCEEQPEFSGLDLVRSTKKGGGFLGMGG